MEPICFAILKSAFYFAVSTDNLHNIKLDEQNIKLQGIRKGHNVYVK
jgi:hypothetical protein